MGFWSGDSSGCKLMLFVLNAVLKGPCEVVIFCDPLGVRCAKIYELRVQKNSGFFTKTTTGCFGGGW